LNTQDDLLVGRAGCGLNQRPEVLEHFPLIVCEAPGDKAVSAVPKLFGAWVVSQQFPLVIRGDIRHLLRAGGGYIADLGAYFPLPGTSSRLAMFFGPSITVANGRYLQDMYGVPNQESASSRHAAYSIKQSGIEAAGLALAPPGLCRATTS
jgi:hypothetical protein